MANNDRTVKVICGRCDGTKQIAGFRHVSNGDCFACNATGYVLITERENARREATHDITESQRIRAEWISNATLTQVESLSWKQLVNTQAFSLWPIAGYPNLHADWQKNIGPTFYKMQDIEHSTLYSGKEG